VRRQKEEAKREMSEGGKMQSNPSGRSFSERIEGDEQRKRKRKRKEGDQPAETAECRPEARSSGQVRMERPSS
jgi:hypothetical protein